MADKPNKSHHTNRTWYYDRCVISNKGIKTSNYYIFSPLKYQKF